MGVTKTTFLGRSNSGGQPPGVVSGNAWERTSDPSPGSTSEWQYQLFQFKANTNLKMYMYWEVTSGVTTVHIWMQYLLTYPNEAVYKVQCVIQDWAYDVYDMFTFWSGQTEVVQLYRRNSFYNTVIDDPLTELSINETYSLCNTIPAPYTLGGVEQTDWTYIGSYGNASKSGRHLTQSSHSSGSTAYYRDIDAANAWFGPVCEGFTLVSPPTNINTTDLNEINITTLDGKKGFVSQGLLSIVPLNHSRTGIQIGTLTGHPYAGNKVIFNDITLRIGDNFRINRLTDTTSEYYHDFGSVFEEYLSYFLGTDASWSMSMTLTNSDGSVTQAYGYQDIGKSRAWIFGYFVDITVRELGDWAVTLNFTSSPSQGSQTGQLYFVINVIGEDLDYGFEVYGTNGPIYASYHSTWNQVAYRKVTAFQNDSFTRSDLVSREIKAFFIMSDPPRNDALTLSPVIDVNPILGRVLWKDHNISGYIVVLAR